MGKQSLWTKSPHDPKAKRFIGSYKYPEGSRREFWLTFEAPTATRRYYFDSWQAAVKQGWVRLK